VTGAFAGYWSFEWPNAKAWIGSPTGSERITFNLTYHLLIGVNAVSGTVWVVHRWRRCRSEAATAETEPEAPGSEPVPASGPARPAAARGADLDRGYRAPQDAIELGA
jgi:hypothetical protein